MEPDGASAPPGKSTASWKVWAALDRSRRSLCRKELSPFVVASEYAVGRHKLKCSFGSNRSWRRFVRHFQSCYQRQPDECKQEENR